MTPYDLTSKQVKFSMISRMISESREETDPIKLKSFRMNIQKYLDYEDYNVGDWHEGYVGCLENFENKLTDEIIDIYLNNVRRYILSGSSIIPSDEKLLSSPSFFK